MNHELNIEVVHWHINTSWHCCGCGASPLCDHTAHHSAARGPLVGHRGCGGDLGWVLVGCERGVGSGGHRRCRNSCTPQSSACPAVQCLHWGPGLVSRVGPGTGRGLGRASRRRDSLGGQCRAPEGRNGHRGTERIPKGWQHCGPGVWRGSEGVWVCATDGGGPLLLVSWAVICSGVTPIRHCFRLTLPEKLKNGVIGPRS